MIDDREVAGIYVQKGTTMGLETFQMLNALEAVVDCKHKSLAHVFSDHEDNSEFLDIIRKTTEEVNSHEKVNWFWCFLQKSLHSHVGFEGYFT